jgi:hypothetical protein
MMQNDRFAKIAGCPENEKLLAFARTELSETEMEVVISHLQNCEFCVLTLELLTLHPQEIPALPDIPPLPEKLQHLLPLAVRRSAKN